MSVPEVKKCCCCVPLRYGIIIFGIINIIFSLIAVTSLAITTELHRRTITNDTSVELITSTILFGIFGMSVILNVLLLVAGCQEDILMLRLFIYYGVGTTLAALIPTFILLSRMMFYDVCAACFAIAMQCYVIILVRSEIVKLENKLCSRTSEENQAEVEVAIEVPDRHTLL